MPDIQLRFHRDMLVVSAPVDATLARQGIDASRDRQYLNVMEPDSILDALRLEVAAGAQCIVATTEDMTQARLAHVRMDGDTRHLARAALALAYECRPQHLLVEIGPCGLPLDSASKASLNENRAQYADAARAFAGSSFDAFFLNGFSSVSDMRCALMGVMQVADKPVFASMTVGSKRPPSISAMLQASKSQHSSGNDFPDLPFDGYALVDNVVSPPVPAARRTCLSDEDWPEAIEVMVDLGASVIGFETADSIECALGYAREVAHRTDAPIMAQLCVTGEVDGLAKRNLVPLEDIDEYTPDTMTTSAVKLYGAGVQFLRATGLATPAYTGSLAATVAGLDVRERTE